MSSSRYQPLVHRIALATACIALLPIVVGAVVTTMKWGMAFRDWPTSDGQNMLAYPWLADLVRGAMDKFTEHGHRLAGMLIGLMSIAAMIVAWRREPRLWVKLLATGVLGGVIVQGLLGGGRVLANDPRMAMVHGNFAAVVFCLMASLSVVTSRTWIERSIPANDEAAQARMRRLLPASMFAAFAIYVQMWVGGMQRHLHRMLYEHVAVAGIVVIAVALAAYFAQRSGDRWLRRMGWTMALVVLLQAALGAGAWITKFGFATVGYVAVAGGPLQMVVRSSHTVCGMLLIASAVTLCLRAWRVHWLAGAACATVNRPVLAGGVLKGGAA